MINQWLVFLVKVCALVGFGLFGARCFQELLAAMEVKDEKPGIETSWGGLGGGLGGWSISKSLVWLSLLCLTVILVAAITLNLGDIGTNVPDAAASKSDKGTDQPKGAGKATEATPAPPAAGKQDHAVADDPSAKEKTAPQGSEKR